MVVGALLGAFGIAGAVPSFATVLAVVILRIGLNQYCRVSEAG